MATRNAGLCESARGMPCVRAVADVVSASNAEGEDGAAAAIERFVLGEEER